VTSLAICASSRKSARRLRFDLPEGLEQCPLEADLDGQKNADHNPDGNSGLWCLPQFDVARAAACDCRALAPASSHPHRRRMSNTAKRPGRAATINQLLRDFRSGEVHPIDPQLLDILYVLRGQVDSRAPFEIISAFRSPATNEMLAHNSSGVARSSLHLSGRAIDIRLPGVATANLRDASMRLRAGGVGYYRDSDFIHVDTGRVRYW
jgi:uncharacterized protein YcbK (DUF882 family)